MKENLVTLSQLKAQYADQYIPYQTRLETREWKIKRDAIVERDGKKCRKCGCPPTDNIWHNGKMYYLIYLPRDPNDLIDISGIKYKGDAFGDEAHEMGEAIVLHVHHLYYVKSKHPWEYSDEALITLCNGCHLKTHETEVIPVYKMENGNRIGIPAETCSRCHGAGYFPQYKKVENGICFQCRGTRYTNLIL